MVDVDELDAGMQPYTMLVHYSTDILHQWVAILETDHNNYLNIDDHIHNYQLPEFDFHYSKTMRIK